MEGPTDGRVLALKGSLVEMSQVSESSPREASSLLSPPSESIGSPCSSELSAVVPVPAPSRVPGTQKGLSCQVLAHRCPFMSCPFTQAE